MSSSEGPTSPAPIPRSSSSDLLPASPGLAPPPPLPSTASSLDKSWSPLRIQKPQQQPSPPCQDAGMPSPTKAHHLDGAAVPSSLLANRPSTQTQASEQQPRRTSSSYKHMKTNSLVSNSPFKTVGLPAQPSPSSVGRPPTKHAIDLGLGVSSSPAISAPPPPRGELQRKQQQRRSSTADDVDDTSSDEDADDRRLRQQQHPDHAAAVQRRLDFQRESKRRQSAGLAGLSSRAKVSASPFLVRSPSFEGSDDPARAAGAGGAGGGPPRPPPVGVVGTSSADEDDDENDDEGHGVNHGYLPLPLEPGSSLMMDHPMVDDSPAFSSPGFSSPPTDHDTTASPLASPPSQLPEEASYDQYQQYVQQQEHQEERRFLSAPSTPSRASHLSATADGAPSPSPKSSLKKKRTRRSAGQDGVPLARRERRKTVTFDERPEVSFFDQETSTQAISDEDVAVYGGGGHWDDYDDEEEMSENEMGGQRLEVPYHQHQLHSHDSNDSFEFEREEIPGSPTPRADESFGEVSMLSNEDDDQYDPNELYSATDSFVTSLLEEHLLSPGSVYSPVFPSEGGESPSLQQHEHQFLKDTSLNSPPPSVNVLSASRDIEDTPTHQPYHSQQQQQQHPKIEQPDLPHLAASPADPILLNGNALEPSTHLPPLSVAHHHQGSSPRRSSSTSSLAIHHHPEVHAHQSGPLPDPFLQVSTVQHHLAAEHEQEEEKKEETLNRDSEDGVPYGRSHHADRFRAVQELRKGTLGRHKHEDEKTRSPSPEGEEEPRAGADEFKGQEMEDEDEENEDEEDEEERRHESQPTPSFDMPKLEDGAGEEEDEEEGQAKEKADVFGEKREISSVNLPSDPPSTEVIPAVSATTITTNTSSSSSSSSHLDAPWHLPSFDSSSSPLFGSVSNFAPSGDAAARAAKAVSIDEFGSLASFKPSSSAERLRAEETGGTIDSVGSLGSNASGGSSAGRSPRLTRDSIRRRMDAKRLEEDAAALKRRRDETGSSSAATATVSASPSLHGLDGLGIGFSGQDSRGHVAVYDGPSASYDEPVASPATAAAPASSPARPTQSSRSSSYEDRSRFAAQQKRPTLAPRTSTLSAHDVLHGESALDRLVAPKSRSASPNSGASSPGRSDTGTLRHGSEKEVVVDRLSGSGINLPSSSPIETAFPAHFLLPTTAEDRARREQEKTQRERELMPPPPLPHKVTASSISPRPSMVPSPTLSSSSEHIEEGGTQTREEAIIARKREKRAQEQAASGLPVSRRGRGRRSLSTGDASIPGSATGSANKRRTIAADEHSLNDFGLGGGSSTQEAAAFGDDVSSELDRIAEDKKRGYRLVERPQVYVASDERVAYNARAGDLDRGKAWRSVKRPSDMNEYAEEIRELRSREKLGRAHSKVFVRIVGITDVAVPLPSESQTTFRIVLNNGLHSVETSSYTLGQTVQIGQEFELLGLDNLEFSLAVKVKKDIHIQNRLRRLAPVVPARVSTPEPPRPSTPTASVKAQSRLSKLLSSPRKPKPVVAPSLPPPPVVRRVEPVEPPRDDLVRYLAPDGTLAVVKVVFKDISAKCNGQILNLGLPLTGRWSEEGAINAPANANGRRPKTIGRMELQLIQIPSIPGLANDQLPQSLDDTIQGLRHVRWHKMDYFTGTLTQLGGDCTTWRRRQMRIVGGTLEATSDVTKKITARIDLSKMVKILNDGDQPMSVERSFTLVFDNGEDIQFFADSEQEKSDWLHHLRELLGRVPSLPLWAELLWDNNEKQKKAAGVPSNPKPEWR